MPQPTVAEPPLEGEMDLLQSPQAVRLMRAYARIQDRQTRLKLLKLTECIAGE
jgi:hypothetical protein